MPTATSNSISTPLVKEYLEQKKQTARHKTPASSLRLAKTAIPADVVVTLSAKQPEELRFSAKNQISQPVTFEEKQALMSAFSVRA